MARRGNPVWSPTGDLIVYAVPFGGVGGRSVLRAVSPDGTPVELPEVRVRGCLTHFDVTPDGKHLVFDRSRQNSDVVLIERVAP